MEEKFEESKFCFNAKISEHVENLTKVFNNFLNYLQKKTKQIQTEIKSHCTHLKFETKC